MMILLLATIEESADNSAEVESTENNSSTTDESEDEVDESGESESSLAPNGSSSSFTSGLSLNATIGEYLYQKSNGDESDPLRRSTSGESGDPASDEYTLSNSQPWALAAVFNFGGSNGNNQTSLDRTKMKLVLMAGLF